MQILLASLLFPPYPLTSSTPLSLLQPQPRILSWLTTVSQLLKPLTVDDADMQHWMTFWREKSCVEPCTSRRYPLDNLGISHLFQEHERKHDAPANRHPPSFRAVGIRSTSKTKKRSKVLKHPRAVSQPLDRASQVSYPTRQVLCPTRQLVAIPKGASSIWSETPLSIRPRQNKHQ